MNCLDLGFGHAQGINLLRLGKIFAENKKFLFYDF